jgi:hypothetical protein
MRRKRTAAPLPSKRRGEKRDRRVRIKLLKSSGAKSLALS